jgi:hypothetical protein
MPECLCNLPNPQSTRRSKVKRERDAAVVAALRDCYRTIERKAKGMPNGWARPTSSALFVIETKITELSGSP